VHRPLRQHYYMLALAPLFVFIKDDMA